MSASLRKAANSNNAAGEFIHAVASLIFKLEPLIAPQYRNAEAVE